MFFLHLSNGKISQDMHYRNLNNSIFCKNDLSLFMLLQTDLWFLWCRFIDFSKEALQLRSVAH